MSKQSSSETNPAIAAAQSIATLINSSPRTPTIAEMAVVIAAHTKATRAATRAPCEDPATLRDNYLASDWHRTLTGYLDALQRPKNNVAATHTRFGADTNAILAKPVRTWDDLIVRAAIAIHFNSTLSFDPAYPDNVIAANSCIHFDDRSLAHVVRGILDLFRLTFDNDGRLLPADVGRTKSSP
jgi:hypothetical protein